MNSLFIIFLIFLILCNTLICTKSSNIAKFFKILDYPNTQKKIHLKPTPLTGGIIFFTNFILFFLFDIFLETNPTIKSQFLFDLRFISIKQILTLLFVSLFIYLISFFDDVHDISPLKKTLLFSVFLYLLLISNPNIPISEIKFFTIEDKIYFNNFSIFFTLFCVLSFMNAANMFDGINLQSSILYFSFLFIFLIKGIDERFLLIFLTGLLFFTYMNMRGKIFLGNNGSYFLSFLVTIIIISDHNWSKNYFVEEIFLYMMLPGIDMIRLSVTRLINNQSPFQGDNNHIHHFLINKFNYNKSIIIIFLLIFIPIILYNFLAINLLLIIFMNLIIYFLILKICSNKN
tara:strand:+ start:1579 stop:2613 length:1035 start_codon:yes stop_codon:yes gene_type:complete